MKIAITGGTGFVGRTLARALVSAGHSVVLIARGVDRTDPTIRHLSGVRLITSALEDDVKLAHAFSGCAAVVHCAGINRGLGKETFQHIHVEGTRNVVQAARNAGVQKVVLMSFLRARPDCGSPYHESKWAAEEIVRNSGLDYTVFKAGVIYGRGDHMLDHLSHVFCTFPVFAFVGFEDKPVRPVAVYDMFPLPLWFHYVLAAVIEHIMVVPMVSVAQVRMLSEGLAEPCPACELPSPEMAPRISFTEEQISQGLPQARSYGITDIGCFPGHASKARRHRTIPFCELP